VKNFIKHCLRDLEIEAGYLGESWTELKARVALVQKADDEADIVVEVRKDLENIRRVRVYDVLAAESREFESATFTQAVIDVFRDKYDEIQLAEVLFVHVYCALRADCTHYRLLDVEPCANFHG
jgi:hypothetical protein